MRRLKSATDPPFVFSFLSRVWRSPLWWSPSGDARAWQQRLMHREQQEVADCGKVTVPNLEYVDEHLRR